jgi:hypothetical protein
MVAKKKNDPLENLRNQVRARRNAVTAKENRIKKNTGVDLRGTKEDPRRPLEVVDKYNAKQLMSYLGDLNAFMSRNSGFVAGANGVPLPKDQWVEYKNLEKKFNSIGTEQFNKIADIFIPQSGMTISQRAKTISPDTVSAQGDIVNRPYSHTERDPKNIASPEALKVLIKDLKGKVSPKYLPAKLKESRGQAEEMLTTIGNTNLTARVQALSDNQFNTLWNYTNFTRQMSGIYFMLKRMAANTGERWYDSVVEDYEEDISEYLDWAESLVDAEVEIEDDDIRIDRKSKNGEDIYDADGNLTTRLY